MKQSACIFVVFSGFFLAGCSKPVPQAAVAPVADTQTISVNTPGVVGAHCFLQSSGMSYPVATPGKVIVRKSSAPMNITCFKGEHMIGHKTVTPACRHCDYPSTVTVAMALDHGSMQRQVRTY